MPLMTATADTLARSGIQSVEAAAQQLSSDPGFRGA